ncbi:MAG TPA: sterol desaturase family protein [Rhizomicrobium sp.]|jgi:sterol desaturase/sphingolipid hydroxylase (fatty acid hydroxylase superfamily)
MSLNSAASFLLDHASSVQCGLFILIFAAGWCAEKIVHTQNAATKLRHTGFNLAFLALVTPIQLVLIAGCLGVAEWVTLHRWGLVYFIPGTHNIWIRYGVTFLMLDFLDYAYHYIAHRVPAFWRLHLVHHSDEAVDVSTTFREHPAETAIRVGFLTLWVFICGASVPVLILRQTAETFANVSQHMTFRLPPRAARIVGWLFVTPNLHHMHHHCRLPGTNCNYGDVFSIWDRLFGTYAMPTEEIVFGIDSHMGRGVSTSFGGLLGINAARRALQRPSFAASKASS